MVTLIKKSFVNIEGNGRKLVEVKRVAPAMEACCEWVPPVDLLDFNNPRIYANIPCWQDENGNLTSIRTGAPIKLFSRLDQVCGVSVGTGFDYEDFKILYTRQGFILRMCRDCEVVHHRCFGEEITEIPKIRK